MKQVSVINGSKDFLSALDGYHTYLHLPYQFKAYEKTDDLEKINFFIVHNQIPEKLDGLKILSSLRSSPSFAAIPVIFLSEPLSEAAKILLGDSELIVNEQLPFNSHTFFSKVNKMLEFTEKSKDFLAKRKQLEICINSQNFKEAEKYFQAIRNAYKDLFSLHIIEARIFLGLKEFDKAISAIDKSLEIQKKSLKAVNLKASALIPLGRKREAQEVLDSATEISQIQLENLLHWGDEYLKRGDSNKATMSFLKVTEMDEKNIAAKEGLLASEILSGKKKTVETTLEDSSMSIELARICNLKAISMTNNQNYKAAQTLYENALNFMSKNDDQYKIWLNLGICMKKGKKYKDALKYFKKCKAIAPPDFLKVDAQIEHTNKLLSSVK